MTQDGEKNVESAKKHGEDEEGCLESFSDQRKTKRHKFELQGDFKIIKKIGNLNHG